MTGGRRETRPRRVPFYCISSSSTSCSSFLPSSVAVRQSLPGCYLLFRINEIGQEVVKANIRNSSNSRRCYQLSSSYGKLFGCCRRETHVKSSCRPTFPGVASVRTTLVCSVESQPGRAQNLTITRKQNLISEAKRRRRKGKGTLVSLLRNSSTHPPIYLFLLDKPLWSTPTGSSPVEF